MTDSAATRLLAERSGTDPADWHLVFKARYGVQVVLTVLAETGSGEVVTQGFTCATAVDPILMAGLRPRYADITPETVSIDPERLVVGASRAIMLQHTFGIVSEEASRSVREEASAAGSLLVEDAAHCVGRMARGVDGAPLADVSIHSFGVEKMLPTKFGGAVWLNPALPDAGLRERIADALSALPPLRRLVDLRARLYRTQVRVLNRLPASLASPLRTTFTRLGLFEPAISELERAGGLPYRPMRPAPWMTAQIEAGLASLDDDEKRRGDAVTTYLQELGDVVEVPAAIRPGDPLVRFPFFAPGGTAGKVIAALAAAGLHPGWWYRPGLFPGVTGDAFGYPLAPGVLPVTDDLTARVVNLPTGVSVEHARRTAEVVRGAIG